MVLILLLSILAWAPLLYPGFIQTHSGLGPVYDALAATGPFSGWLPAYGAPGDGPLATWLLVIVKAGLEPLAALKLLYILTFVGAACGMYLLARRTWGSYPAVVGAAVYLFVPYRLVTVYVRGALAEALLLALAPFVWLAFDEAVRSPRRRQLLAVALLVAAASLTHIGLALLTLALGVAWSAASADAPGPAGRPSRRRYAVYLASGLGLLAALLVVLPGRWSFLANAPDWADHFVGFYQLFSPLWGFGDSGAGWQDGLSFQLGLAPVVLAIAALWLVLDGGGATRRRPVATLIGMVIVLVGLALGVAAPLWRIVPLSALVAFPFQLLGLAALPLALLAAAAAHGLFAQADDAGTASPATAERRSGTPLVMVGVLLAFTVLASYTYLAPRVMNSADMPDLTHAPLAQLGDDVLLLDARVVGEPRAGSQITVVLIWQALRQPVADYTVFVHLLDERGNRQGQQDARPHQGNKPTTTWLRGEVVRDDITLTVAQGAPPGDYRLTLGMYQLATMQRLPVAGADRDAVEIGPIIGR